MSLATQLPRHSIDNGNIPPLTSPRHDPYNWGSPGAGLLDIGEDPDVHGRAEQEQHRTAAILGPGGFAKGDSDPFGFGDSILDDEQPDPPNRTGSQPDFGNDDILMDRDEPSGGQHSPQGSSAQSLQGQNRESETRPANEAEDSQEHLPDLTSLFPPRPRLGQSNVIGSSTGYKPPIRARTSSGKPVVFTRRVGSSADDGKRAITSRVDINKLLEVPIHRLMDSLSSVTPAIPAGNTIATSGDNRNAKSTNSNTTDLWVDRYRPRGYLDLLGDERVHRDALLWLKEWDRCVFKKVNHKKSVKRAHTQMEDDRPPDEYGRPHEKILLLSGPPGLGKTTLAHVIAAKAGYSVLEINASDARTGNIIDDRVRPALESGQGIKSTKPVLVIIDEVDGATGENSGSFVQKLIQLTLDKPRKKRRPGQKRDPQEKRPILRPIICICNDLWASSIARLRTVARIVRFNPASPAQLAKRLREICDIEKIQADSRALTQLVAISQGDMRGCINTLQMIHKRCSSVTEAVIRGATAGMKESEATTQSVWNDIFLPLSKKRVKDLALSEDEKTRYVGRLSRLIDASGAVDKVALGCFEHYPNLHRHDPSFKRLEAIHSWLGTFDHFSSVIRSDQDYALMGYLSYFIIPFHPLYADLDNSKAERPKADWECYTKMKSTEEIFKAMAHSLTSNGGRHTASYRHLLGRDVMLTEFAPLLNRIISPPLRPVNSQIIRPEEKLVLKKLVDIMVSLELRFVQERDEDGQMTYRLDPPIDVAVTYEGKRAADIAVPRYAIRHMVATEIESESAARHADTVEKSRGPKISAFFGKSKVLPEEPEEAQRNELLDDGQVAIQVAPTANTDEHPQKKKRTDEGYVDIADKPPTDFFGRPLPPKVAPGPAGPSIVALPKAAFSVSYRFHEGSSAAVRRPVKIAFLK